MFTAAKMVTENLIFAEGKKHTRQQQWQVWTVEGVRRVEPKRGRGKSGQYTTWESCNERNVLRTRNYGFSKRHLYGKADTKKVHKRFDKRTCINVVLLLLLLLLLFFRLLTRFGMKHVNCSHKMVEMEHLKSPLAHKA